jgi:cyclic pyranopterin phosphate synthase
VTAAMDRMGRPLRDLRISVTDRCNFRCGYCMPREHFGAGYTFLQPRELLTFDEITCVAHAARRRGVRKIRLTGGEPLMRPGVDRLVAQLSAMGGLDIAMTTNGSLLGAKARALATAGLQRVTISLDSTDPEVFARMSDTRVSVDTVLRGIDAAVASGIPSVKVNMVVRRGMNESAVLDLVERYRDTRVVVRFIEYMDVGTTNGWQDSEVVPSEEIRALIDAKYPLVEVSPQHVGEVATRYRFRDSAGEIGLISSISEPFCHTCTRLRLSSDGKLHTCLFGADGHDLKSVLRAGGGVDAVEEMLRSVWGERDAQYSFLRQSDAVAERPKVEMSYIGG